jgi:hypothetical protein
MPQHFHMDQSLCWEGSSFLPPAGSSSFYVTTSGVGWGVGTLGVESWLCHVLGKVFV